jgi:hypothetical protein
MKKLLVFREGLHPDSRELDDYLYDSEVIRSDFIDMSPDNEIRHQEGDLAFYASSWEVIFKGDEKYDQWHLVCEGSTTYSFEEQSFKALNEFFPKHLRNVLNCNLQICLHKMDMMVCIYRLPKAVSHLLDTHLQYRFESFKDGKYHYEIPESALGPVLVLEEEVEVSTPAKDQHPRHAA